MSDNEESSQRRRIAVVGGGISGLSATLAALEHPIRPRVTLFEAADELGGVIRTVREDGFLIELGPDMFTTRESHGLELCRNLGLDDRLLPTNQSNRGALIVRRGKLLPIPDGMALMAPQKLAPLLRSNLISFPGKLRILAEAIIPRSKSDADESLESFASRRFGRETYRWLIQPLISGIYTADPTQLSMQATMDEFVQMERESGSLIRAARRKRRAAGRGPKSATGARYGMFLAPDTGMAAIISALRDRCGEATVRTGTRITHLQRNASQSTWTVEHPAGSHEFDGVILALRGFESAELLDSIDRELAQELDAIPYASTAVIVMAVPRSAIEHPIHAFGVVVPLAERRKVIAVSFANHKFAGRAPDDWVILRVFVGGACQGELLKRGDEELLELARDELSSLIGLDRKISPRFQRVARWERAMPQYHVGHRERVERIESKVNAITGLELAGNAFDGVGIPACIHSGQQAAERLLK